MLKEWNTIAIAMIPKVNSPSYIKDFRPLSCCNVIYKCISKILENRIQSVIPTWIGPAQSAFVKGRSIMDNVLISKL